MKCTECGNVMTKTVGEHHYRESGLDNVVLQNVPKYTCESCGAERVTIGAIGPLHRAIAKSLAEKPARLLPAEVGFLRDHLELSNKEFAELMGVSPEVSSRWTSSEPIGVPAERFLRVLAVLGPEGLAERESKREEAAMEVAGHRLKGFAFEKFKEVAIASTQELIKVIDHMPPKDVPAKEVEIGLRRAGATGWKSNVRDLN